MCGRDHDRDDRNRRINADNVFIRANRVVIQDDDDRRRNRRDDVRGIEDRNDNRHRRNRCCWF